MRIISGHFKAEKPRSDKAASLGTHFALGFVTGCVRVFGSCAPFGVAMAARSGGGLGGLACVLGAAAGYLVSGSLAWGLRYMAALVLVFTTAFLLRETAIAHRSWFMPAVAAAVMGATGALNAFDKLLQLSVAVDLATEVVLTGLSAYLFHMALTAERLRLEREELRREAGGVLILCCALMALARATIMDVLCLGRVAAVLCAAALTVCCAVLVWCFFSGDNTIQYVLDNRSTSTAPEAWLYLSWPRGGGAVRYDLLVRRGRGGGSAHRRHHRAVDGSRVPCNADLHDLLRLRGTDVGRPQAAGTARVSADLPRVQHARRILELGDEPLPPGTVRGILRFRDLLFASGQDDDVHRLHGAASRSRRGRERHAQVHRRSDACSCGCVPRTVRNGAPQRRETRKTTPDIATVYDRAPRRRSASAARERKKSAGRKTIWIRSRS